MEPGCISGRRAGSLRLVPYAARHRLSGKSHAPRRRRRLSRRRPHRRLVRQKPARRTGQRPGRLDRSGHRSVSEDRTHLPFGGVRQHGRGGRAQHPIPERRRPVLHRPLPEVPASQRWHDSGGDGSWHRLRSPARRRLPPAGSRLLCGILRRLPPPGRQRRGQDISGLGRQQRGRFQRSHLADPYRFGRRPHAVHRRRTPWTGHARPEPPDRSGCGRNSELCPFRLGQPRPGRHRRSDRQGPDTLEHR